MVTSGTLEQEVVMTAIVFITSTAYSLPLVVKSLPGSQTRHVRVFPAIAFCPHREDGRISSPFHSLLEAQRGEDSRQLSIRACP